MVPAIGFTLREQDRTILDDLALDAVEIPLERADGPQRKGGYIGDLHFDRVSMRALMLSPGCADPPDKRDLDFLAAVAAENGADSISGRLGVTPDARDSVAMGHFRPVPCTQDALDVCCRNIDLIQEHIAPLSFYIENIAYSSQLQGTMSEDDFLYVLLRRTGCGWLLDLTNVYANATNFGFDPYEFIADVMPAADRVQMRLAGGFYDEAACMYVASHSHAIPEPLWDLYGHALRLGSDKVRGVFLDRDSAFPDDSHWRREVRQTRRIAEAVDAEHVCCGR